MKTHTIKLGIVSAMVAASSLAMTPALAWGCPETRSINTTLDIGDIEDIRVVAGAGELNIVGSEGSDGVEIEARLCASDEDLLAEMDVISELDDDRASIATDMPKRWSGNYTASIDLTLTVPVNSQLNVKDSSGDLSIENVRRLTLVDSSGDISLKDIEGNVVLTDSSGAIKMRKIGSAEVTDSSGEIDARGVSKDFTVNVDSSGDIEVRDVGGDVLIKVDSSGSINVDSVSGSFTVVKDGSGGISYDDIGGEVKIPQRKR